MAFVNSYALYYHAYCSGFRIPVEGVDYIDFAVALLSFGVLFISTLGSLSVLWLLKLIAQLVSSLVPRNRKKQRSLVFAITIAAQVVTGSTYFVKKLGTSTLVLDEIESPIKFTLVLISILATLLVLLRILLLIFGGEPESNYNLRKKIAVMVTIFGIVSLFALLFNQSVYSAFLRNIKYGGDIPVSVEYRKADNTESNVSGMLLIRTKESLTLRVDSSIHEIPMNRISKIETQKK